MPAPSNGSGDGTWTYQFEATDNAGNVSTIGSCVVKIDTQRPQTVATGLQTDDKSGWSLASQTVGLTPSDAGSGIATTYYTVDGGARQTYSTPFSVSGSGSHRVTYWSVDNVGNVESPHAGYVNIDTTPPVTAATGLAANSSSGWEDTPQLVTLERRGQPLRRGGHLLHDRRRRPADIQRPIHRLRGRPAHGHLLVGLRRRQHRGDEHRLRQHRPDAAGHHRHRPRDERRRKLDERHPADGLAGGHRRPFRRPRHLLHARRWRHADLQRPLSISAEGLHTVTYWSLDGAGNIEPAHTGYVGIDTTAPTVSDNTDSLWHDSDVIVTLTGADPGGWASPRPSTAWTARGTWLVAAANQFIVPAPANGSNDGAHTYDYRAIDNVGHASAVESCTVKIDATAPVTVATSSDGLALDGSTWHAGPLTVTLAPTDPLDTFGTCSGVASTQYSTDGGATWTTGTSVTFPVWKHGGGSGAFTLLYRSTDQAGNTESQKSASVQIDNTPPTTTETGADLAWHSSAVTVDFNASDAGWRGRSHRVQHRRRRHLEHRLLGDHRSAAQRLERRRPPDRLLLGRQARQHRGGARLHRQHRHPAAGHRRQRRQCLARGAFHLAAFGLGHLRHHHPVLDRRRSALADGHQRALHERLEAR